MLTKCIKIVTYLFNNKILNRSNINITKNVNYTLKETTIERAAKPKFNESRLYTVNNVINNVKMLVNKFNLIPSHLLTLFN